MRVEISKITSAINKITDLTSGDKIVPGVMLEITKDNEQDTVGTLNVCYSDGHKSLIEELEVVVDENDYLGKVVVGYEALSRVVSTCQPSGIIKVNELIFSFENNNILRISSDKSMDLKDNEGNVIGSRRLANNSMDIVWAEPSSSIKTSILTRMKYEDIFNVETFTDNYTKKELVESLSKTSVEKGRQIYVSSKLQAMFVANQAHVTSVPISKYEVTLERMDEIRATLSEQGLPTDDESMRKQYENEANRVKTSLVIPQNIAKALIGILGKTKAEEVYIHRKGNFCNIFIDTDEEKLGVWFEMPVASRAHLGALERYESMQYKNYQILFLREFLESNIKSALNVSKSEKVAFKFEPTKIVENAGSYDLVISSGSSAASISDTYRTCADDVADINNNLLEKTFNVSLKVLSDMLSQLKTQYVALDFNEIENGNYCIRLSEVDIEKMYAEYTKAREETKAECEAQGITFDPNATPTPVEKKLNYRVNTLITKQYTMLSK